MSRSTRPTPGSPREYHFPKFDRRLLANGMKVLVDPTHNLPIVTVLAVIDAGGVAEPAGQEGIAELTARALNEGTPKYDGEALTDYMEHLGTSVGGAAGWDSASVAMTVLRENLENAFVHFAEVLVAPTFPVPAIERLKAERQAELMQIESEPRGYTYGASSAFDWRREAGPFVIGTAVASDVTVPAVQETLKEVDRMRSEPISESELSLATSYLGGVFPIRYETTAAIATALATLTIYGLPEDWYDTYRERMSAVTVDDVLRAAHAHIKSDSMQIVVVGDEAAIREPLEALGFGPLDVVSP